MSALVVVASQEPYLSANTRTWSRSLTWNFLTLVLTAVLSLTFRCCIVKDLAPVPPFGALSYPHNHHAPVISVLPGSPSNLSKSIFNYPPRLFLPRYRFQYLVLVQHRSNPISCQDEVVSCPDFFVVDCCPSKYSPIVLVRKPSRFWGAVFNIIALSRIRKP